MVEKAGTGPKVESPHLTGADLINNCFVTHKTSEEATAFIERFNSPEVTTAYMAGRNSGLWIFRDCEVPKR